MTDAIALLGQMDGYTLAVAFWHMLIFEVPRYALATVAVVASQIFSFRRTERLRPRLSVSVLLPGHNEAHNLRRSVLSIREQTVPPTQIVIVDDGSTDPTLKMARTLAAEGLVDVVLTTHRRSGKSAAANLGLSACTGDIIIIADADTTYDRDAFEKIIMEFDSPAVGAVAGDLGVRNPDSTLLTSIQAIQYLISISLGRRVSDMFGILYIVSGAFGAFRREALDSVGGWDVGPGEDADLTMKIRRAGWRVRFAPDARGLTDVPETLVALMRQRLRWNRSLVRIRMRKFKSILDPWSSQFSVQDAIGLIDILLFQFGLAVSFTVYLIWLVATYSEFAFVILAVTTLVYAGVGTITFLLASFVCGRPGTAALFPVAIIYGPFNSYVLRFVRLAAYLQELVFRRSYSDDYVPSLVRQQTEKF